MQRMHAKIRSLQAEALEEMISAQDPCDQFSITWLISDGSGNFLYSMPTAADTADNVAILLRFHQADSAGQPAQPAPLSADEKSMADPEHWNERMLTAGISFFKRHNGMKKFYKEVRIHLMRICILPLCMFRSPL